MSKPSARVSRMLLKGIEEAIGREELLTAFDGSDDPRFMKLVAMAANPEVRDKSLAQIAKMCGLNQRDFSEMYRRLKVDEGIIRMAHHLPQVMEDIAIDAKSVIKQCWKCQGRCKVGERICPECQGTGKVRDCGDPESRKLVLNVLGLIAKNPLIDARQIHLTGDEPLEDTLRILRPALQAVVNEPPILPAEVVSGETT